MLYYVYLPNTNVSIYLNLKNLEKILFHADSTYYDIIQNLYRYLQTDHKENSYEPDTYNILYLFFNLIDKKASINRNLIDSELILREILVNHSPAEYNSYKNFILQYLESHYFNSFNSFMENTLLIDYQYILISLLELFHIYFQEYVSKNKISEPLITVYTKCSICENTLSYGYTTKQLLQLNKLYIYPRDSLLNVQRQFLPKISRPVNLPINNQLTDTISLPLTINNKQIDLIFEIKQPTLNDYFVYSKIIKMLDTNSNISSVFIFPNLFQTKTYEIFLSLSTLKINIINEPYSIYKYPIKIYQLLEKLDSAENYINILTSEINNKYYRYINPYMLTGINNQYQLLHKENIEKIECSNCHRFETYKIGFNLEIELLKLINKFRIDYEQRILGETLLYHSISDSTYNDLHNNINIPKRVTDEYNKHIEEFRQEKIKKLKQLLKQKQKQK